MKTIINSSKRINNAWLNTSIAILTCLIFMILPSCQKDSSNMLNQESLKGFDMVLNSSSSGSSTVIYEHRFTRANGAPVVVTQTLNFDFDQFEDNLVLKIQNGSDKKTRVSSAEIKIDGALILGPSDFSKNTAIITKEISGLTSESILEVKLNSAPWSFIDLWIEGKLKVLTDCDGNIYETVTIGDQVWMAENLKTTKYNDCTPIPLVTDNTSWATLTSPGYCWYNNDAATYKATYGALYNWYSVDPASNGDKNVCPTGWHVPNDVDWVTLITYLGGESIAGNSLKEIGTTHWQAPNEGATNESGFTALPGGYRNLNGVLFYEIGNDGYWWSASEYSSATAWSQHMYWGNSNAYWYPLYDKHDGFSIRCLKNN
jgi:uncharacterized protein (TIGR02145 family)